MEKTVLIINALCVLIGLGVGIIVTLALIFSKINCILQVREGLGKDQFQFVVLCPIDQLKNKKYLIVKIKKGPSLIQEELEE